METKNDDKTENKEEDFVTLLVKWYLRKKEKEGLNVKGKAGIGGRDDRRY